VFPLAKTFIAFQSEFNMEFGEEFYVMGCWTATTLSSATLQV
jgi:hypothetical protein